MTTIRILSLGGLRIMRNDRELTELPAQPVRCGLLLYLALERTATRDALTALFWPERDGDRARHSLRQTLYELRRRLGSDWLDLHGDQAAVRAGVTVDAIDFAAACAARRDDEALLLFAGPFLQGLDLGASREWQDWSDRWRVRLGRTHRDLCRRMTAAKAAAGAPEAALAIARRWVEADPFEDEAQHRLIELLAGLGRRAEALRQYDCYVELIARELGVQPLEETQALVARIRDGRSLGGTAAAADALAPLLHGTPTPRAAAIGAPGPLVPETPAADAAALAATAPTRAPAMHASAHVSAAVAARLATGARSPHRLRRPWVRLTAVGLAAAGFVAGANLLRRGGAELSALRDGAGEGALALHGVAVLPFVNLSADPEQEYFSDGVTEDVLTSLSRIEGIRVISRTSVWRFKGAALPLPDIARELGVRYVVEGSVRRDGDQVRITAQLIDAVGDAHLWADTYDRRLPGMFEIQSDIAERIAAALERRLPAGHRGRIAAGATTSPVAYDLLLRGREYLNRPSDADARKFAPAIGFFRRALELDPGYAHAYVGISTAFRRNPTLPVPLAVDSALAYAQLAVAADPELAAAVAALGSAYALAGQLPTARAQFERSLALDRNQADALAGLARLAALDGRLDEAVRWQRRARAVDPSSAERLLSLGEYLFDLGDLTAAQEAFQRAVDYAPDFADARFLLAQVLLIRTDTLGADDTIRVLGEAAEGHAAAHLLLGRYHAQRGRYALAARHLEGSPLGAGQLFRAYVGTQLGEPRAVELGAAYQRLRELARRGVPVSPRPQLYLAAMTGDADGALRTLEAAWRTGLRSHSPDPPEIGVYWIDREPILAPLRRDPRFAAALARMRVQLDSMRALTARQPPTD